MLNASIFGNMLNAPKSPEEYAAERENLLASRQANALNRQKMDEYAKGVERQNQLRTLLSGGADSSALRQAGFLNEAADWDKNAAIVAKEKAAAAKDTNDVSLKTWQAYRDQSSMIRSPQEAAAWITRGYNDPVIGPYLQRMGTLEEGIARIPQDPAGFESWRMSVGMNVDKLADHALKQKEFGLKQDQFGETVRHNKSTEGIQLTGIRLADSRAREATAATMSKPFEVTGSDGQPVLVQQDKQGNIRPVQGYSPKTAADKPLPEAAQKQVMGARNLQDAVGGYLSKLEGWSNSKMLNPDQRAEMGNAYNNMMLQAKEAYNLGVLNGPDYDILQSVVKDPTKLTSVLTSNQALGDQARSLRNIAANIEKTALEAHGKKYTPRQDATKQLSPEDQQAAAWAQANPSDPRAAKIKQRLGL